MSMLEDQVIYARRRCPLCHQWLTVGERFAWVTIRTHGVERRLPAHTEHIQPRGIEAQIEKLKKKAEEAGHGYENEYGFTDQGYADPSDFWVI